MSEIATNLGKLRRERGFSAIRLAAAANISRQTIYAIEAGTYVPNTAVALRLARALDASVEELFTLAGDVTPAKPRSEPAVLLPGSGTLQAGQRVQLCRVDQRLMASAPSPVAWHFPVTDAVVAGRPGRPARTRVQLLSAEADFTNRILVAGCDPGISVLSRHAHAAGIELVLAHRNSSQALLLLKEGSIHIAGTHLIDEASGESNLPKIGRLFPNESVAVISFAVWDEGLVIARRNPKNIRGVEDLSREDVSIVNREKGAGSRDLLDSHLKRLRIEARNVRGYDDFALGHLQAAWQVLSGTVDCCVSTRAVARVLGLTFIPLVSARYDLAIRKQHLHLTGMQDMLDILSRSDFRRELGGLGGYETKVTGQRLL